MTDQEVFDKVVAHARQQKEQALEDGSCRYRTADGKRCFAGIFIKDEVYDKELEGKFASTLIHLFNGINIHLLSRLQDIHDIYDPYNWENHFKSVARDYDLIYSPELQNGEADQSGSV